MQSIFKACGHFKISIYLRSKCLAKIESNVRKKVELPAREDTLQRPRAMEQVDSQVQGIVNADAYAGCSADRAPADTEHSAR